MDRYLVSALLTAALLAATAAPAQQVNKTVAAQSGAETMLSHERSWDDNCAARSSQVTITRKPANGTVSVVSAQSTIPASTPRFGSTGKCAGKPVSGNQVMYRSNPGFHGTDTVSYDVVYGAGKGGSSTIVIDVK